MSDPAHHAAALAGLPAEPSRLNAVIQGLLVHGDLLEDYGLVNHQNVRTTLSVSARLDTILTLDRSVFAIARPPERRAVGTCRDFALLLASCLRVGGIPARVRCGFAAYFGPGWADHWVCEYRDPTTGTWCVSDAQIDAVQREKFGISFDPARVPQSAFLEAGRAWQACRSGHADAALFGHGDTTGLWFLGVNVVRDHYALNRHETSAWDAWREAPQRARVIRKRDIALLDALAADPMRCLETSRPSGPWKPQ